MSIERIETRSYEYNANVLKGEAKVIHQKGTNPRTGRPFDKEVQVAIERKEKGSGAPGMPTVFIIKGTPGELRNAIDEATRILAALDEDMGR